MMWNDGILESWNNGFKRIKSFFDTAGKTRIKIRINSVFKTQHSIIPTFHHSIGSFKVNSSPWGEIKAGLSGL
jgi:hypothetical protein